jgi:hypothetical protein
MKEEHQMCHKHQWKLWTIGICALLGGVYGLTATLVAQRDAVTIASLSIAVVGAAALCGCAASAFCRWASVMKLIGASRNPRIERRATIIPNEDLHSSANRTRSENGDSVSNRESQFIVSELMMFRSEPHSTRQQLICQHQLQAQLSERLKNSVLL